MTSKLPEGLAAIVLNKQTCRRCKFSRKIDNPPQGEALQCRRNAPQATAVVLPVKMYVQQPNPQEPDGPPITVESVQPQIITNTAWPIVPMDEKGCGEWKQRQVTDDDGE